MSGPLRPSLARVLRRLGAACLLAGLAGVAVAQAPAAERTLRYRADGQDFVIENGAGRFNRALYGPNDAFRVNAGERPEFALALPVKGGLVRLGVASATSINKVATCRMARGGDHSTGLSQRMLLKP